MYAKERGEALKSYRYSSIDKSYISRYILKHYWNWCITLVPLWIAPNLITLTGWLFVVFGCGMALCLDVSLEGPYPRWLYVLFAACLWIYSTLDNLDGKQARRTGSSSPLGELFDHGIDALNCSTGVLIQVASLGLGNSKMSLTLIFITFWGFFLPTWEEYHTGTLYLGTVNGPTEGLLLSIGTMLASAVFGPQIWSHSIDILGCLIRLDELAFYSLLTVFLSYYLPSTVWKLYKLCREKQKSFLGLLGQLFPMIIFTLCSLYFMLHPESDMRGYRFPLIIITIGIVFGKMATKIIYAYLTKLPFPRQTALIFPLYGICVFYLLLPLLSPHYTGGAAIYWKKYQDKIIWSWFLICVSGYLFWAYNVIQSFCSFLKISCFTLSKRS